MQSSMVMMTVTALPLLLAILTPVHAEQVSSQKARKVIGGACISCHGKTNPAGSVDLSTDAGLQVAVTSGRLERVLDAGSMPLNRRLTKDEDATLRTLLPVKSSAPALWSLSPISNPQVPKVAGSKHPVDAFVLNGLKGMGITANPPATKSAWLRRVTVDLTGLPPTADETATFVADQSASARQKVIDRLLASPAYGERMARLWLDVARFGESHGYEQNHIRPNAWPYRDYVIKAFNSDRPYSDFIQEQLAGDVLGKGNPDILPATGFLVAGIHDTVPSQVEEATRQQRANDLEDIVATVGASVMGLTIGCARCHDHKFDPISQRDFYSLEALFSGVYHGETDLPRPSIKKTEPSADWMQRAVSAHNHVQMLRFVGRVKSQGGTGRPALNSQWNEETFPEREVTAVRFEATSTNDGHEPCIDELQVFSGDRCVSLSTDGVIAVPDSTLSGFAEHKAGHINDGRFGNPNSWISATKGRGTITLTFPKPVKVNKVAWSRDAGLVPRFDDRVPTAYSISVSTDGKAWETVATQVGRLPGVTYVHPDDIRKNLDPSERIALDRAESTWKTLLSKDPVQSSPTSAYTGRFTEPEPTYLLARGDVMQRKDIVAPAAPKVMEFSAGTCELEQASEADRRLAFAKWLTSGKHPTVARVIVNRIWQQHFGRGIVAGPSDFGNMGGEPSHPALLDHLATWFVNNGWSIKKLHRYILTSDTYARSSFASPAAMRKDAGNVYLWRMPVRRMEAEMVRDAILSTCGNLDRTMYGPGYRLYGYDVVNVARFTDIELPGKETWRRGIYSIAARGVRDGFLGAFDCPESSVRTPRRDATTTALQSLALWNGKFLNEQASLVGAKANGPVNIFMRLMGRRPDSVEASVIRDVHKAGGNDAVARVLLNSSAFISY
ncbi:MAG: DUF1549 domain-containing protein [Armatimonadota bacterium]